MEEKKSVSKKEEKPKNMKEVSKTTEENGSDDIFETEKEEEIERTPPDLLKKEYGSDVKVNRQVLVVKNSKDRRDNIWNSKIINFFDFYDDFILVFHKNIKTSEFLHQDNYVHLLL